MNLPDWHAVHLVDGVLREATPERNRIVVWLPRGAENGCRHWQRVGSVAGTEFSPEAGICAVAATSVHADQQVRSVFAKFVARMKGRSFQQGWLLPNGDSAEQRGERQTDLLLVWPEDPMGAIDEICVRCRWPQAAKVERIGISLLLVSGVTLPARPAPPTRNIDPAPEVCPRKEAEQLLATARQAGDPVREASALNDLAVVCTGSGEAARSVALLEDARALLRGRDHPALEADILGNMGLALQKVKQPQQALGALEQSLQRARSAGDRFAEKTAYDRIGIVLSRLRDPMRAVGSYEQALKLARELGDRRHEAEILWQQAVQLAELGKREQALARGQAAVEVLEGLGSPQAGWFAANLRRYLAGEPYSELPESGVNGGSRTWTPRSGARPVPADLKGPGLLRMAYSAAKSLAKLIGSGLKTTPVEVRHQRLRTCASCEHHTGMRCRVCGCFTSAKTLMLHEQCPLGKWSV